MIVNINKKGESEPTNKTQIMQEFLEVNSRFLNLMKMLSEKQRSKRLTTPSERTTEIDLGILWIFGERTTRIIIVLA